MAIQTGPDTASTAMMIFSPLAGTTILCRKLKPLQVFLKVTACQGP
jgi:hypothetical protein